MLTVTSVFKWKVKFRISLNHSVKTLCSDYMWYGPESEIKIDYYHTWNPLNMAYQSMVYHKTVIQPHQLLWYRSNPMLTVSQYLYHPNSFYTLYTTNGKFSSFMALLFFVCPRSLSMQLNSNELYWYEKTYIYIAKASIKM